MRVKISQVLFTSYVTACPKSQFVYRTVYKRLLWQVIFNFAKFKAISETSRCWAAYQSEVFSILEYAIVVLAFMCTFSFNFGD